MQTQQGGLQSNAATTGMLAELCSHNRKDRTAMQTQEEGWQSYAPTTGRLAELCSHNRKVGRHHQHHSLQRWHNVTSWSTGTSALTSPPAEMAQCYELVYRHQCLIFLGNLVHPHNTQMLFHRNVATLYSLMVWRLHCNSRRIATKIP